MSDEPELAPIPALPDEAPPRRRPYLRFWQAVLLVIATTIANVIVGIVFIVVLMLAHRFLGHPENPLGMGIGLSYPVAWVGVLLLAARWSRAPLRDLFPFRRAPAALLLPLGTTLMGFQLLAISGNELLFRLLPPEEWVFGGIEELLSVPLLALVLMVVFAPVAEEMMFRGLILQGFLRNYSRPTALLLSTLLFVAIHGNPWQFLAPLALGLLLGWCMLRTRALWLSILGHAIWNGLLVLPGLSPLDIPGYTADFAPGSVAPYGLSILGLFLGGLGLRWMHRRLPRVALESHLSPTPDESPPEPSFDKQDAAQ